MELAINVSELASTVVDSDCVVNCGTTKSTIVASVELLKTTLWSVGVVAMLELMVIVGAVFEVIVKSPGGLGLLSFFV